MKLRLERRSQALFLHASTAVAWRSLGAARLASLLGRGLAYNARVCRAGEDLEIAASIAPLPELEARRRVWLADEIERVADSVRGAPPAEPPSVAAAPTLDPIRRVAETRNWTLNESGADALEITFPREENLPPLAARSRPDGVWLESDLGLLPASRGSTARRLAVIHAALEINSRLALARLRLLDPGRALCQVECHLPGEDLDEDEAEFAVEGVRVGAIEATRVMSCLRDEKVARVYAAAQGVSLHNEGEEE